MTHKPLEERTREEHLQWCKDRALAYVELNEIDNAFASMCSDITKHPETASLRTVCVFGMTLMANGHLDTHQQMRDFIKGFN